MNPSVAKRLRRLTRLAAHLAGKKNSRTTGKSEYIPPLGAIFYRRDGAPLPVPLIPALTHRRRLRLVSWDEAQ
jgi:hypothetical protein